MQRLQAREMMAIERSGCSREHTAFVPTFLKPSFSTCVRSRTWSLTAARVTRQARCPAGVLPVKKLGLRCTLTKFEPFTVRPSLKLPVTVLGIAGVLAGAGGGAGKVFAVPVGLLGVFLVVNAGFLLRFRFGPDAIEVWKRGAADSVQPTAGDDAALRGYRYVRGWHYDRIEYWKLWWPRFPVLFYFRESESYDGRGSIHFLPVVFDAQQWLQGFSERTQRKDSGRFRY